MYNSIMTKAKLTQVQIGNRSFILPFKSGGFWVTDSRGNNVADCPTMEIANGLAETLNKTFEDEPTNKT